MNYPAILEEAWQQHLALREPGAPTVISTFAGAGGSSLGYSMVGYRELLAVEWDDNAVATFKLNFPDVPVYHGDIAKLTVEECLQLAGIEPGQLDVLDGSPPCQGFSTAGKRILDDSRNQLFREYVRLLRGLRPKVFVMENVSGMVKGKMKLIFAEVMRELKASGYRVSCRLLNAMYFHVPQSRERLIWIGVREDLGREPSHPEAESGVIGFGTIMETGLDNDLTDADLERWKLIPQGKNWQSLPRRLRPNAQYSDAYRKLAIDKPSYTLPKTVHFVTGTFLHPTEPRHISCIEMSRIGSFPDSFRFVGDYQTRLARIGNSVPPLFMRAIARHVRSAILTNGQG